MKRFLPAFVGLILLVGCTTPTNLAQVVTDARAAVQGAELALPAFAPFLTPAALAQVQADLASADKLSVAAGPIANAATQATNLQGVLNLVSGAANVIAANLPANVPPNVAQGILALQAVMALVQADAPILAPFVGQKAGGTTVPPVFRSGMTPEQARAALGAK